MTTAQTKGEEGEGATDLAIAEDEEEGMSAVEVMAIEEIEEIEEEGAALEEVDLEVEEMVEARTNHGGVQALRWVEEED